MQTPRRRFQDWFAGLTRPRPGRGEPPLRGELFGVEQLTRHARDLASRHRVVTRRGSNHLMARLGWNEEVLRSFNRASLALSPDRRMTPAAEWLLDNFYLIEEQIQMARRHLPRGYSRQLPRLVDGPCAGLPRVHDIVLELISHVDAQIDAGPLAAFVASYQTVQSLKLSSRRDGRVLVRRVGIRFRRRRVGMAVRGVVRVVLVMAHGWMPALGIQPDRRRRRGIWGLTRTGGGAHGVAQLQLRSSKMLPSGSRA